MPTAGPVMTFGIITIDRSDYADELWLGAQVSLMNDPAIRIAAVVAAAAISNAVLSLAWHRLRATTLRAPTAWAAIALTVVTAVDVAAATAPEGATGWIDPAQYVAAVATLLPIVAVLGAKRPQDRAWQLIVLSLWIVLALPAVADLLYHYGSGVSLDTPWRGFLLLLVGAELVNYLPTRYWPACVCVAVAQTVLLAPYLRFDIPSARAWRVPLALALVVCAALSCLFRRQQRPCADVSDSLWPDFRDSYGILWALRVRERSRTARLAPAEDPTSNASSGPTSDDKRTLIAHLQRFVSPQWIAQRERA